MDPNFFDKLPDLIFRDILMEYLNCCDILNMRRVCKSLNNLVKDYINGGGYKRLPNIKLDDSSSIFPSWKQINDLDLQLSGIELETVNGDAEEKKYFTQKFGHKIERLYIHQICLPLEDEERLLLEGFVHLSELTIDQWIVKRIYPINVPDSVLGVKVLRIREVVADGVSINQMGSTMGLLFHMFTGIRKLTPPSFHGNASALRSNVNALRLVQLVVDQQDFEQDHRLEELDLKNIHPIGPPRTNPALQEEIGERLANSVAFFSIFNPALLTEFKMRNVPADVFKPLPGLIIPNMIRNRVSSITNGNAYTLFGGDMLHLEEINISSSRQVEFCHALIPENADFFPNLKTINLVLDSLYLSPLNVLLQLENLNMFPSQDLINYLLCGNVMRASVKNVSVVWKLPGVPVQQLPDLRIRQFIRNIPNLQKLELSDWHGNDDDLGIILSNLASLKELSLTACSNVTIHAFTQIDTKITSLSLLTIDKMNAIDDDFLKNWLRDQSLDYFRISSHVPVTQISIRGMKTLLGGRFAETIRRFDTSNLLIRGNSPMDIADVKKLFRSHELI